MGSELTELVAQGAHYNYRGSTRNIMDADGIGGLMVSQNLPSLARLTAENRVFSISPGVVANYGDPVQDMPTTASLYTLYNTNATTTKVCLIPLMVSVILGSGTPDVHSTLIAGVTTSVQSSAVANSTGVVGPKALSGSTARSAGATLATGITLAAAPAWVSIGCFETTATAKVGAGIVAHIPWGMFVVPPGKCLATHVFAGAGTSPKYGIGVIFAEVEFDWQ